jgi:predicted transcriptional regulator
MVDLTEKNKAVYDYIVARPLCSYQDLQDKFNLTRRGVENHIQELERAGIWFINKQKKAKKGRPFVLFKIRLWSAKNKLDCCKQCQATKVRHKGQGLCLNCHDKNRAKNPKRQAQLKANHDRWYIKVKNSKEYIDYTNERARVWRTTDTYKRYLQRVYRKGRARRAALNKQNKGVHKETIVFSCECCGKKVKTPYTAEYIEHNFQEFNEYKKYLELKHQGIL